MKPLKVLNLYAGIGGNRKLWQNVEVTAVEQNAEIAKIYSDFFPDDKMIIGDAHQYLLEHFAEYDFIWSSPPCPTHSNARYWASKGGKYDIKYPDMTLYQEILLLQHFAKGLYVVENVQPYYEPLIEAQKVGRHLFWSNFNIENVPFESNYIFSGDDIPRVKNLLGFNLDKYKISGKVKILRNCVNPKLGLHVLDSAIGNIPPIPLVTLFSGLQEQKHA